MHIPEYTQGTWTNHSARRKRKLLLNRVEIDKIERRVNEKGLTVIPLALYFVDGRAKVEIALAQGQEVVGQAARPGRAAGQPRDRAGRRPPAQGHAVTEARPVDLDVAPVRAFWEGLGLPGLFDVHVHFLPPNIQRGRLRGLRRRRAQDRPRVADPLPAARSTSGSRCCARWGSAGSPTLPYAHKPGVATYLNDWAAGFAADVPESLRSATFYPEPDGAGVRRRGDRGRRRGLQGAPAGGGVPPRRRRCSTRSGALLEDAGTPVVVHAGSGPVGNEFTGPASMAPGAASGSRGWRSSSPTWARPSARSSWRSPSPTSGSASTPRWCSPTSSAADYPPHLLPAAASTCGDKVLLGTRLPDDPLPLRPPARGPGPARPGRRLAARGLLGQRQRVFGSVASGS